MTVPAIDDKAYTVGQLFDALEAWGAGIMRVVASDENDRPTRAIIVMQDAETIEPVLEALDALEEAWSE